MKYYLHFIIRVRYLARLLHNGKTLHTYIILIARHSELSRRLLHITMALMVRIGKSYYVTLRNHKRSPSERLSFTLHRQFYSLFHMLILVLSSWQICRTSHRFILFMTFLEERIISHFFQLLMIGPTVGLSPTLSILKVQRSLRRFKLILMLCILVLLLTRALSRFISSLQSEGLRHMFLSRKFRIMIWQ